MAKFQRFYVGATQPAKFLVCSFSLVLPAILSEVQKFSNQINNY